MTLKEFVSDPRRAATYRAWINRPDTVAILEACRDEFVPAGLTRDKCDGATALYYAGLVDMYRIWSTGMFVAEELKVRDSTARLASDFLKEATYGAPVLGEDEQPEERGV